jgi:integrase/recombinase XerD
MNLENAVGEFLLGYFSMRQRSQKTKVAYEIDLKQFQAFVGAQNPLHNLGVEQLETWAAHLKSEGYASPSMRRKFATVRVFVGFWVRRGVLQSSPFWRTRLDFGRERRLPRSLSASDAKCLVETAWSKLVSIRSSPGEGPHNRFRAQRNLAIVEILFATGMRVGELAALDLVSWNSEERWFLVEGKGLKERLAMLPDDRSLEAMRIYLVTRSQMDLEHGALFVGSGGCRLTTQGVARIIVKLAADAGIKSRVTPHMLRHTVATLLLRLGADIRVVQEVLGHSSITTTQRYTHISKEHLKSTLTLYHPSHHLGIESPPISD